MPKGLNLLTAVTASRASVRILCLCLQRKLHFKLLFNNLSSTRMKIMLLSVIVLGQAL
jgi:hypothetical protein